MIFKTVAVQAVVPVLPDDFEGINTKNYVAQLEEDDAHVPSMMQTGSIMFELGRYFDGKYPNDEIFSDDYEDEIIEELRKFLPNEDTESLRERLSLLRNSVKIYRTGKSFYDKYVEQKLVPHDYKKVHSAKDYDHDNEFSYIEADDGEFNKIYNFKKFLSYSDNPDERLAIRDFEQNSNKEMSIVDKIDYMYRKIEWKKLPSYGRIYKNPLLSDLGIGEWQKGQRADARLISPEIYTDKKEKIYAGINIFTDPNYFILANNLNPVLQRPVIDFSASENITNSLVLYPVPLQSNLLPFAHKYFGDFVIPAEFDVTNSEDSVTLKSKINLVLCDSNMSCHPENFDLELKLNPSGREFLPNGLENFFNMAMRTVPQEASKNLTLSKTVIDEDVDGQSLRLEFKTNERVRHFKVFAEQKNGFARFDAPLLSVRDGEIYAKFKQFDNAEKTDLRNSEFIITAELNGTSSIRQIVSAKESAPFTSEHNGLTLHIIFLAFLGGVILNFMPCIFPVLSLKIIALSRATARKRKNLKASLKHTVFGILSGFALIIVLLCVLKYLGESLGWGMQFQNMGFLVAMIFVIASFIIVLPFLNLDNIYRYTINIPHKWLNYSIGFLTVLLATPCTGPYMATAVGFALSGSYFDLIAVLVSLALGLSAPYLLIYFLPKPEDLFPKSGKWLGLMQLAMFLLLILTLVWFTVLLWRQTDWQTPVILLTSIAVFMICFRFYLLIMNYLGRIIDEAISETSLKRAKNIATFIMLLIFGGLLTFNIYQAQKAYQNSSKINAEQRILEIDKDYISKQLAQGKNVLLEIKADWCLTCQYNQAMILTDLNLENWQKNYNLEFISVDWTNYSKEVLDFMEQYGRKGLPFYILFTPLMRDGVVLPEIFSPDELTSMLINSTLK